MKLPRYLTALAAFILTATGCQAADVHAVLATKGVTVTDDQAEAIARHYREQAAAPSAPRVPSDAALARLRRCESGLPDGHPRQYTVHNRSGKYHGAYQFDLPTWRSVGGQGDPHEASPATQDAMARRLYMRRGRAPWPECGKRI